jgi:hypothetical protein
MSKKSIDRKEYSAKNFQVAAPLERGATYSRSRFQRENCVKTIKKNYFLGYRVSCVLFWTTASSSLFSWLRKNVVASFQLANRRIEALRQARSLSPRFSLEDALVT